MASLLYKAGDVDYPWPPDLTSDFGFMSVYQIFRNCQCLNNLRVRFYDLGILTTWLYCSTLSNDNIQKEGK